MSVSVYNPMTKGSVALASVMLLALGSTGGFAARAEGQPGATPKATLTAASPVSLVQSRGLVAKGQYKEAVAKLETIVKEHPDNAEGQLLLGQAYSKLKNYQKAREHLRLAVRTGKGSASAQKANMALLALPSSFRAPKTGAQTRLISSMLGLGRTRGGEAKPTVIDFYAPWCQPCKQLDSVIARAKSAYGDKVAFMTVNVDDPSSQAIMDQYDVSPIPTMVFLSTDGEVVTYSIGYGGDAPVNDGIKKILPKAN
ncbi:MAG: tetratricopeptide repeat protein [Cyanobacteria bacterium SZAS LIN-3]|nr:tetratricopeptide repeat protein [Cyanobacteria bacterium SZAS LIN-3]